MNLCSMIHMFIVYIYVSGLQKIKKWLGTYSHFDRGPKGQYYFCRGEHQILQLIYDSRSHFMIPAATFMVSRSHFGQVARNPVPRFPDFLKACFQHSILCTNSICTLYMIIVWLCKFKLNKLE